MVTCCVHGRPRRRPRGADGRKGRAAGVAGLSFSRFGAPALVAAPGRGDAEWQGVSGTRHKFFVYSAYCDDREKPLVRVIAATKTKKPDKVIQF